MENWAKIKWDHTGSTSFQIDKESSKSVHSVESSKDADEYTDYNPTALIDTVFHNYHQSTPPTQTPNTTTPTKSGRKSPVIPNKNMTIIVYPCNPDININNKKSSNSTSIVQQQHNTTITTTIAQPQQNLQKSALIQHNITTIDSTKNQNRYNNKNYSSTSPTIISTKRKSSIIENRKSSPTPPLTPTVDNKDIIMTKSPLGSQIDITSNLEKKPQLDPNGSRKVTKTEPVVIHHGSTTGGGGGGGGGAVGNFFKNHLRNPSPSKNRHQSPNQQTSPKSTKKSDQNNISPTSTLTQQQKKAHEQRHGSFSSPFKMPKFSSNSSSSSKQNEHHQQQNDRRLSKQSDIEPINKPDTNLISTATSALRRLHFKSGRNAAKAAQAQRATVALSNGTGQPPSVVPKVIVMGSSSTSETTINTSTDSANTIITTMTNTDEYLTEDSLDKQGDDSLDMIDRLRTEQLIDIEPTITITDSPEISPPHKTCKIIDTDDVTTYQSTSESTYLFQDDDAPMTIGDVPKTAFYEKKFTFETPTTPQTVTKTPKSPKLMSKTNESKFNFDSTSNIFIEHNQTNIKITSPKTPLLKRRQSENLNLTTTSEHKSQKSKKTSASISSSSSSTHHRSHSRRRRQSSPRNEMSRSSQQNGATTKKTENTQKLPDLRVDYFSNSIDASASTIVQLDSIQNANHALINSSTPEKILNSNSVCLNQCLREVGARLECALTPCSSGALGHNINVTTNPLDSSTVHQHSMNLNRSNGSVGVPQATIVVQQPSLSLDSSGTTNVSTVLLKNGIEFISNVNIVGKGNNCNGTVNNGTTSSGNVTTNCNNSSKSTKRQQREENMKQLLDVANTLTLEELHDFEMRYGSPHHSRSQSVKTPGRSSGGRPNYLCLPQQRSRVASMPNTGVEEEYYRLRHFSITGKGVVNRGDSLKSRRSRSNNSVASSNSSTEHLQTQPGPASYPGSARTSVSSRESSNASQTGGLLVTSGPSTNAGVQLYRVAMLGASSVGKSSLVSQFMTSEYLHAYDTSIDDDSGEKTVSVLLAGEESELTFIDLPHAEMSPDNVTGTYSAGEEPQAYCVVYSCADRGSLEVAERALATLWTSGLVASKAVILVANKADLVRSRAVTTDEGKAIATQYDCKFIETSVGINHNVDELLVGLLTQIRLKLENPEKTRDLFRKRSCSKKNRNKSPNRVGTTITSALTSCGGGSNPNGEVEDVTKTIGYCWGTASSANTDSPQNSPKKYRGTRTSASLKVKGLLGKVWARDSKSKSCENLHVL